MELRPVTSHKENVPPRPVAPQRPGKRPEQRRFLTTLGVSLGSGHGSWVPTCQAARRGPATTCSSGTTLGQEPHPVQTNLASPCPHRIPSLRDKTGWLVNSSYLQQSNVQLCTRRPPRKEPAAQQSNLGLTGAASPPPQGSLGSPACLSPCLWQTPPATDPKPTAGFALPHGRTWPGPRFWGGLGSQTSRLAEEPLTLEDLADPAQREAQHSSRAAVHQLLASVWHLEWQAAHLGGQASWESPDPAQWGPCPGNSQALPAHPRHSRPVLASCYERRRQPHSHREIVDLWVTRGTHTGHSDSRAPSEPASPKTTLGMQTGHFQDSKQAILPAQPLRPEDEVPLGPTYGWGDRGNPAVSPGSGSRETWPGSSAFSSAASARRALPGLEEACTLREPGERTVSGSPGVALARRGVRQVEPKEAGRQLLSRCLRAWVRVIRRWRVAVALGRRQLLRGGFRALRWTLWLREAQLEVARRQHAKVLLAQTLREWRRLVMQQKQGQPHVQPASRPCASWGGKDQVPHWGGEAVGHCTPRSRARHLEEEEEAKAPPLKTGRRPDGRNGGDRRIRTLQELQQLAVFLLWCQKKYQARKGPLGEVTQRTQRMGVPPMVLQPRRDWLRRCFWAWQRVAQREAQCQGHLADRCRRTVRMCLGQWVRMKQLRASEGAKVTQLSLCLQKGACQRLALCRVLLLWRMRLSQHQRAKSTSSVSSAATSDLEPLDGIAGGSAWLGCSARWDSLEKDRGAPDLPGTPLVNDLWAAGRQQQDQRLLLWRQAWGSARRCCSLQRRILLTWSHWTAAQGAWRELAARQARDQNCRAALGLWRWRLAQQQEAARWAQERGRGRAWDALRYWCTCWQRQQLLREKYRSWVHGHLQDLQRAVFWGWWQEVARRRHMRSHFQAWCELIRDTGVPRAWDTQRRRALRVARGVTVQAQEQRAAQPCILHWSSCVQQGCAGRQLSMAWAQQAFAVWRVALGWRQEAQKTALCWTLELRGAHAAQSPSAQSLVAWAQGHVRQATITQLPQAGLGRLLRSHWAQWRTALLRVQLDPGTQAQGTNLRLAGRGHRLRLTDAPAPWRQTRSCWTQATGSTRLRPQQEAPGAHGAKERPLRSGFQLWPGHSSWASTAPGKLCGSEIKAPQGEGPPSRLGRKYPQRWRLEVLCQRFQFSQRARYLRATWQHWADAPGAEQLSQSLLRQWHLGQAWRVWRRRVLQLQVARRLQHQENSWVFSQAFERWHQHLAARSPRRGGTSQGSQEQAGRCPSPGLWRMWDRAGVQLQL